MLGFNLNLLSRCFCLGIAVAMVGCDQSGSPDQTSTVVAPTELQADGEKLRLESMGERSKLNQQGHEFLEEGKHADAEQAFRKAASNADQLGVADGTLAESLNGLALSLQAQQKHDEVERLFLRSIRLHEQFSAPDCLAYLSALKNLAGLHHANGNDAQFEEYMRIVDGIYDRQDRQDDPDRFGIWQSLVTACFRQAEYANAERYLKRLVAFEERRGASHNVAHRRNELAITYEMQGKYADLVRFYSEALPHCEWTRAPALRAEGRFSEAERIYKKVLAEDEQRYGVDEPGAVGSLLQLAAVYREEERFFEAEVLTRRALAIVDRQLKPNDLFAARIRYSLALLLEVQGNHEEASCLESHALWHFERTSFNYHCTQGLISRDRELKTLLPLADRLLDQGKFTQAEATYWRVLQSYECLLTQDQVSHINECLASALHGQARDREAAVYARRASVPQLHFRKARSVD